MVGMKELFDENLKKKDKAENNPINKTYLVFYYPKIYKRK